MNDDQMENADVDGDSTDVGFLDNPIIKFFGGAATGIPKAFKKQFVDTAGKLIGPYFDVLVAKAEGRATLLRARNDAKASISKKVLDIMGSELATENPIMARALAKEATRLFDEQVTVEDILAIAAEKLSDSKAETEPSNKIDDDWVSGFEREAKLKSSSEMKEVFGRILAGEIERPGSFSLRAIRTISTLSQTQAETFRRFCSLSIACFGDRRVVAYDKPADQNGLQKYGFSFNSLNELAELGLIQSQFNTKLTVSMPAKFVKSTVPYAGGVWLLESKKNNENTKFELNGVGISCLGIELIPLLDLEENIQYTKALSTYFDKEEFSFTKLASRLNQ